MDVWHNEDAKDRESRFYRKPTVKRDSKRAMAASGSVAMIYPLTQEVDQDQQLIEAVQAGDGQGLADLIARNDRWVRGVVYSALGDANLLDDVMQKIWLAVWQRCKSLDDPRKWRHWLYRMAKNAAIDAGRRKRRQWNLWRRLAQEMLGRGGERSDDPARCASVGEEHHAVLRVIESMPAIYREPFVLRHLEGWTYRHIAQTLDLPIDTVGTRLVRARKLLAESLAPAPGSLEVD